VKGPHCWARGCGHVAAAAAAGCRPRAQRRRASISARPGNGAPPRRPSLLGRDGQEQWTFKDRIGIDLGRSIALEDGIAWAARHGVSYFDAQTDIAPNAMESFDANSCARIAAACERHGLHLGLHTLSAVNVAEISPFLREAADQYLRAYIDLAARLKAEWVVVHGGYHFTSDVGLRKQASIDRLKRAVAYAEERQVLLLLENLNGEPERAEVHYMPDTLADTLYYFEQIPSPQLKWAFTVNHAHYDALWHQRLHCRHGHESLRGGTGRGQQRPL
jgi:sugar phosphate isomerase/epimerase